MVIKMIELPCEFCPVFPICYSKVCQSTTYIYGVVCNCSIMQDFLKVNSTSFIAMTWNNISNVDFDKLTSLADKFKFRNTYLYRGWKRQYKNGWV